MGVIKSTYREINNLVFIVITAAIGFGGFVGFVELIRANAQGVDDVFVLTIEAVLYLVAMSFPVLVIVEKIRDRRLYKFLAENVEGLAEGVTAPDGEVLTFETVMVRYEANLMLVVLGSCFQSGLYRQGKGHRLPKVLYTTFSLVFGWWSFDWQVWLDNATSIGHNLASTHHVTIGELFESG